MERESKKIEDISFEEFEKKFPNASKRITTEKKRSLLGALFKYPFKFLGAIFGIDKKTIESASAVKNYTDRTHTVNNHTSSNNIRERYAQKPFNPYDYDVASQLMYLKLIDGKGDPELHDCDCDHDR